MNELETLLGAELFKTLTEKLGDKKIILDDGKLIPKSRFDEVNDAKNGLQKQLDEIAKGQTETVEKAVADYKKQLADVQKQLKIMEKASGDNEELQKKLADYQTEIKTKVDEFENTRKAEKEAFEKQMIEQKTNLLLENNLIKAQARNPKAVKALLELDKIKLDGDNLLGLNEQIEKLKSNESWLFGETTVTGQKSSDKDNGQLTKDFYTEQEVDGMTPEFVRQNLDTVMKSMKLWNQ